MKEIVSVFNDSLPFFFAASAFGLAPRLGLTRAVWIALRSRFARKPNPECLRTAEIKLLRRVIANRDFGQSYLVVTGENGVGKTCLLDTVTSKTLGVIKVSIQQSDNRCKVIKTVLQELTGSTFEFFRPFHCPKRVIFWHRLVTLGQSPIVVINVVDGDDDQQRANIAGAVRTLVEKYRLRVIVKGSINSIDENLFHTRRQHVFDIKPMTREMIWQMGQLRELFKLVKEAGLDDTVFAVLGGIPADYENLWSYTKLYKDDGRDTRELIGGLLCAEIIAAIKLIQNSKLEKTDMKQIIALFDKDKKRILWESGVRKLQRPTPDHVFREVEQDGVWMLTPASNAIGIVLQHGLTRKPTLNELEDLIRKS